MANTQRKPLRGSNQSADTKYAAILVREAISLIESGRIQRGVDSLNRALANLPDMGAE